MGGRGASLIRVAAKMAKFEQIPRTGDRPNEIDGVPIMRFTGNIRAHIATKSDLPNVTYLFSDVNGEIAYIGRYENHVIVESVDIDYENGHHLHLWKDGKRKSHDKSNNLSVPDYYKSLLEKALEYNHKYFDRPEK